MLEAAANDLNAEFEKIQASQVKDITDKVAFLESWFAEAAISFNEELHPSLLTITASRRWLLSCGLKHFLTKCLHSSEYHDSLKKVLSCAYVKVCLLVWNMAGLVGSLQTLLLIGLPLKRIMIPPWLRSEEFSFLCWIV